LFAEDSPAKTSPWLENVLAWVESDPGFGGSSLASLGQCVPVGFWSRTSLAYFPPLVEGTLPSSFPGWSNSGMAWPGGCLTLNTSEWPSGGAVCSLSEVLEAGQVPRKYYLSPKAARGILRRAEKRGRELPSHLRQALDTLAMDTETHGTATTSPQPCEAESIAQA
jgi:hypothetical protein